MVTRPPALSAMKRIGSFARLLAVLAVLLMAALVSSCSAASGPALISSGEQEPAMPMEDSAERSFPEEDGGADGDDLSRQIF